MKLIKQRGQWPEIFQEGEIGDKTDRELCAAAFCAHALLITGNPPPPKFGEAIAHINPHLGFSGMNEKAITEFATKQGWL